MKLGKKALAVLLVIVMVLSILPTAVLAAEEAITVYATVSNRGQIAGEGEPVVNIPVTVPAQDGVATVDAALVALHELYGKNYVCKGYVTTCWSVETSNCLFFVNDAGIQAGVTVDTVQDGDRLTVSINSDDETYSDWYTCFDKTAATVATGDYLTLTLSGYQGMMPGESAPIANAEIGIVNESGFQDTGKKTNANGSVTLSFATPGTYCISAAGTVAGAVTDWNLMNLGGDPAVYGTMDWTTYDSFVAYTETDYGDGPYPADEIKYVDFFDWNGMNGTEKAQYFVLHSNTVLKDCPIIAPYCIVTVKQASGGGIDTTVRTTFRLIGAKKATQDVDLSQSSYLPEYVTWISTTPYNMPAGSTVYNLFMQALADAGLAQEGAESGYVSTVYAPAALGGYALSEFTNGTYSGWMYTVNGRHTGNGIKDQRLSNGDSVVFHYVNDYRHEVADLVGDAAHPSLGDGTYYNGWLRVANAAGGIDPNALSSQKQAADSLANRRFTDVPAGHWAADAIEFVTAKGIMEGVGGGRFSPETSVSRAMLVTVLYRMASSPSVTGGSSFVDVAPESWYAQAVAWASANGIVSGVGGGKFAPTAKLTREQLATMLMRFAAYLGRNTEKRAAFTAFTDAAAVSTWAADAMQWANAEGLMSGRTATRLAPQGTTTRAELAVILMRFAK